jgi:hypothetical protein
MKSMKYVGMMVLAAVLASVLAACGGATAPAATNAPSGGNTTGGAMTDTAENTARGFIAIAFGGEGNIADYVCSAGDSTALTAGFSSIADTYRQMNATMDVSGFTYTVTEEGDRATIAIGGNLKFTVSGTASEAPMTGLTLTAVKEGDAWKICG